MKNNSIFNKKPVLILLSVLIAFGLWLYVIMVVSPNSEISFTDVPVELQGNGVLDDRMLIITEQTTTVNLRLSGNRTDLNKVNRSNSKVLVDVTKIYDPGVHELGYTFVPPGDIASDALTIQVKNPNTVRLVVERKLEKEIPIEVNFTGKTQDNYFKVDEELDRQSVMISGPESVVSTIEKAVIQVDLDGHTQTIIETKTFTLCDAEGKEVKNDLVKPVDNNYEVNVTVPIVLFKELPLKLTLIPGGGANEENTQVVLSHTMLSIYGPEAIVSEMTEISLGSVDLAKLKEPQSLELEVKLPEGVTNETGVNVVTASITFPGLSTKNFRVTQIEYVNLPEGMRAQLVAEVVEVVVRGNASQLQRMEANDITVLVDLSQAIPGTEKYAATVKIAEPFDNVGAIGSYTIAATVESDS